MRYFTATLLTAALVTGLAAAAYPQPATEPSVGKSTATAQRDPKRLWCSEHEAYEDECFICHPELREKGRLWCAEHARYEDRCFICHPELRDASRPYCEKHFLYQDECHLCRPELKKGSSDAESAMDRDVKTANTGDSKQLMCKEHGVPEAECGMCHPELAGSLADGEGLKVRFASPEAAHKAGIRTAKPESGGIADAVKCYAEIIFNQNKLAEIVSPVSGRITHVAVGLGDQVAPGALLTSVASPEIAEAVNTERLAKQTLDRERQLYAQRISAQKDFQAAESAYDTARQTLASLGVANSQLASVQGDVSAAALELRAPFAGEIVERHAVGGSLVDPAKPLFVIADRSAMWAQINVPESQLALVRAGQTVELTLDAAPGRVFKGTLTWVSAQVDERTRMARALADVPNPDGSLRAQSFARARIVTAPVGDALTVPRSAIQNVEGRSFAFIKHADDLYEARAVRVGASDSSRVSVTGIAANDDVVVEHSYLVKSQLQISRLGAGCTD